MGKKDKKGGGGSVYGSSMTVKLYMFYHSIYYSVIIHSFLKYVYYPLPSINAPSFLL